MRFGIGGLIWQHNAYHIRLVSAERDGYFGGYMIDQQIIPPVFTQQNN